MTPESRVPLLLALILWGMGGCGDSTGGPETVATVSVIPNVVTLDSVGDTAVVRAAARTFAGNELDGVTFMWRADGDVVAVEPAGPETALIRGVGEGNATVEARVGQVVGQASVGVAVERDEEPPELRGVSFSPTTVDVSNGAQVVRIRAQLADPGQGVVNASAQFESPVINQVTGLAVLELIRGDRNDGVWEGPVVIPEGAPGGTWKLFFVRAGDRVGNAMTYSTADLRRIGVQVDLEVFSN